MTQDQPETSREQLARQAVEAYNELTAHAEELSPGAAQAVRSLRETLTSLVALGTAADLQIADMERTMEEFEAIYLPLSDDGETVPIAVKLPCLHQISAPS